MMTKNEGTIDRAVRVVLAVVLAAVGLGVGGTVGWVLAAVALVPLLTAITGFCPLYALLHLNTLKRDQVTPRGA